MAKVEDNEVAVPGMAQAPAFLKGKEPVTVSGTEDMQEDFAVPRTILAQATTKQTKKRNDEYIAGLEEGMYFHSITGEVLGESFEGHILKIWNSRVLFDDDNGVDCFSPDTVHGSKHEELCENCNLGKWDGSTPPACAMVQNHLVADDEGNVTIVAIKLSNKHSTSEAKNIRTQAKLCEKSGHGLYAYRFKFASKMVQNAGGNAYYVTSAKSVGYVKTEEQYDALRALAEDDRFKMINKPVPRERSDGDESSS